MSSHVKMAILLGLSGLIVLSSCNRGPDCSTAQDCAQKMAALYPSTDTSSDPLMRALAIKSCDLGNMSACSAAGEFVADGTGGEPDWAEGARLLRKACDGGIGDACKLAEALAFSGVPSAVRERCVGALMPKQKKCRVKISSVKTVEISYRQSGFLCLIGTIPDVLKCTKGEPYDVDM